MTEISIIWPVLTTVGGAFVYYWENSFDLEHALCRSGNFGTLRTILGAAGASLGVWSSFGMWGALLFGEKSLTRSEFLKGAALNVALAGSALGLMHISHHVLSKILPHVIGPPGGRGLAVDSYAAQVSDFKRVLRDVKQAHFLYKRQLFAAQDLSTVFFDSAHRCDCVCILEIPRN